MQEFGIRETAPVGSRYTLRITSALCSVSANETSSPPSVLQTTPVLIFEFRVKMSTGLPGEPSETVILLLPS